MATNQYIGARYVPLFAEPYQWDGTKEYEPLTIVYDKGNSYTSRQYVPSGIDILDDQFWALTGNYNAQVEQYREEVITYNERINKAQNAADSATDKATEAKSAADNALSLGKTNETDIAANDAELAGTAPSGLKTLIDNESARATAAESANSSAISKESDRAKAAEASNKSLIDAETKRATNKESELSNAIDTKIATKFPITANDVSDGAITAPKMATSAVQSILQGFTVRAFDSTNTNADNEGLVCPSDFTCAGFYVVELGMLVLTKLSSSSVTFRANTGIVFLPSYVPRPASSFVQLSINALLIWDSSNYFFSWSGLRYHTDGSVRPNTDISNIHSSDMYSSIVQYLGTTSKSNLKANYTNAINDNSLL